MELKDLQSNYKSLIAEYDKIEVPIAAEKREATPEEITKQDTLLTKIEALKSQIQTAQKAADLKAWGEKSSGSKVGSTWEIAAPGDGALKDVVVDKVSGEMAAKSFYGEEALKTLQNPDYNIAVDDYLRATALGYQMEAKNAKMLFDVRKASKSAGFKGGAMKVLNEGSFTGGEAWLPPDFRNQLIERLAAPNTVRQNASVFTTGTDIITFPIASYTGATDDTTADIYPVGTRGTWRASGDLTAASEATNPVAGNLRINVNLYTLPIITTREQLEDNSFDLLGWVTKKATEVAMLDQEQAYTKGNGVGKPFGFMNHPALATAYGSTVTAAGVTYTGAMITSGDSDLLKWPITSDSLDPSTYGLLGVSGSLPIQYEQGAKWFGNKRTYTAIQGLGDTAGRPLWYGNGPQGNIYPQFIGGFPADLLGYPIVKNVFMDNVAKAAFPLVLGNMQAYYIVDRVGVTVEVFRETLALYDQVLIYLRMRTGGQLVDYYKMRSLEIAA